MTTFDIIVTVRHLASDTPINGFLFKEPISGADATIETAQKVVDALQDQFGKEQLTYITLFTRDRGLLINTAAQVPIMDRTGVEISIPKQILEGSILAFQIVKEES